MAKHEQWDEEYALSPYHTDINSNITDSTVTSEGYVATQYGFVSVWSRCWSDGTKHTVIRFIHGGRMHSRTISNMYQPRYLVTLAKQFAAAVAAQEVSES